MEDSESKIIKGVILSMFEQEGPTAINWFPSELSPADLLNIAMKSISLLMGEATYQSGNKIDTVKYFGILPYPELKQIGLTYFFLIPDKRARGRAKASTITILVNRDDNEFLYKNIKTLSLFLDQVTPLITSESNKEDLAKIMEDLKKKLITFSNRINFIPDPEKSLKIVFSGLDAAGKTSIRKALDSKPSEINRNIPTIGIDRSSRRVGNFIDVIEWDCGGQDKYRSMFIKRGKNYLDDTDGIFYIIDIKRPDRFQESIDYLKKNIEILSAIQKIIPIAILIHKSDPESTNDEESQRNITYIKEECEKIKGNFDFLYFETTIFKPITLWNAYSRIFSQISPNREILREQLKNYSIAHNGLGMFIVNGSKIILSDYIEESHKSEFSDEFILNYINLFRTLKDYEFTAEKKFSLSIANYAISYFSLQFEHRDLSIIFVTSPENEIEEQSMIELKTNIEGLIEAYL